MELDMTVNVDLQDVKNFIESEKFCQFLLNNTTQFTTAAFILQSVMNAVEEAAATVDND